MFSSLEVHRVSTVLSGRILYRAERSTPVTSVAVAGAEIGDEGGEGFAGSGLGAALRPLCASVTVMLVAGAVTMGPEGGVALEAAEVRLARLPPRAAAYMEPSAAATM